MYIYTYTYTLCSHPKESIISIGNDTQVSTQHHPTIKYLQYFLDIQAGPRNHSHKRTILPAQNHITSSIFVWVSRFSELTFRLGLTHTMFHKGCHQLTLGREAVHLGTQTANGMMVNEGPMRSRTCSLLMAFKSVLLPQSLGPQCLWKWLFSSMGCYLT